MAIGEMSPVPISEGLILMERHLFVNLPMEKGI